MPRGPIRDADEVRHEIVVAAEALIVERGVRALRLRDVLARSGASNGQLYGAFRNLDEIVLQVGRHTLRRLERRIEADGISEDPLERLVALARSYLAFAAGETPLWRALFEYEPRDGGAAAEELMVDQARLFDHAAAPLAELFPDLDETERLLRARTLFSAVHGIVSISLESRFAGVAAGRLEEQLTGLVRAALAGYRAEAV